MFFKFKRILFMLGIFLFVSAESQIVKDKKFLNGSKQFFIVNPTLNGMTDAGLLYNLRADYGYQEDRSKPLILKNILGNLEGPGSNFFRYKAGEAIYEAHSYQIFLQKKVEIHFNETGQLFLSSLFFDTKNSLFWTNDSVHCLNDQFKIEANSMTGDSKKETVLFKGSVRIELFDYSHLL